MRVDAHMASIIRLRYITGSYPNEIYRELQKHRSFDPKLRLYELEQIIKEMSFSEYELKLREEIIFCKQQIKARIDYFTLSCSVVEAQQQQARLQEQIQEAMSSMEKITLVPTQ